MLLRGDPYRNEVKVPATADMLAPYGLSLCDYCGIVGNEQT